MIYLKFLWSLIRHKWFVFVECWRLGIPWLGIVHDWTKFLPSEFVPYARNFYGDYPDDSEVPQILRTAHSWTGKTKQDIKCAFDVAWLHHQKRNRHHWQYWLLQYDKGETWSVRGVDIYPAEIVRNGKGTGVMETEGEEPASLYSSDAPVFEIVKQLNLNPVALPIPDRYRREMLADWRGAGRAYGNPDTKAWYLEHRGNIILHPETRQWIDDQIKIP